MSDKPPIDHNSNVSASLPSATFTLLQSESELCGLMECMADTPISTVNDKCDHQIAETYTFTGLTETPLVNVEELNTFPSLTLEHSHFYSNVVLEAEFLLHEEKEKEKEETLMTDLFTRVTSDEFRILHQHNYGYDKKICDTLQGELFRAKMLHNCKDVSETDTNYVAIKKIDKALFTQQISVENGTSYCVDNNIVKEALILKYLTLDNNPMEKYIVKYIEFFESDNYYYLVCENFADWKNLKSWIQIAHKYIKQNKLKFKDYLKVIRYIFWQIMATLYWLHVDMNCCHLNLCLKHILLKNSDFIHYDDGTVSVNPKICSKLNGFGLAELFKCSGKKNAFADFTCMKNASMFSDVQYQSPNIVDNRLYDARKADNWALGMMLYHCAVGEPLYDKVSPNKPRSGTGYWAARSGLIMEYIYCNKLQTFINGKLLSLIYGLINPNERKRLSSPQILKHQWFGSYYQRYEKQVKKRTTLQKKKMKYQQQQLIMIEYYCYK